MIKNKEIWKDIKGYEGLYEISNRGRVKSLSREYYSGHKLSTLKTTEERIMSTIIRSGYEAVLLSKNGRKKCISVHRLVAQVFIPNSNNYPQVNHLDEDKLNNKLENLEWCTAKYNINYGDGIIKHSKARSIPIYKCDIKGNILKKYPSATYAKLDGYDNALIGKCCRDLAKTHKGYKWRYTDE